LNSIAFFRNVIDNTPTNPACPVYPVALADGTGVALLDGSGSKKLRIVINYFTENLEKNDLQSIQMEKLNQ
jgi:hypothetical protein